MASSNTNSAATRRTVVVSVVILAILAILLAALAVVNWLVRRPATVDAGGTKDRNYLFSIYGFEGDLLRRPTGVGVDSKGNIYVADTGKRRIVVFGPTGGFLSTYGDPGKTQYGLWDPIEVAVAPDGRSYVIDKTQRKMVIYDATHKPVKSVTFADDAPTSVTIANNQLFVTTESGVIIGNLDGQFESGYVARGKNNGQFDRPGGVAVGKDGTLYVADSLNYRVQAIGTNGKVKWVYGKSIPASQAVQYNGPDRKFGLPSNIALDDNGFLYVVDGLSSELVVLNTNGEYIDTMGGVGHNDGTFYYPDGIAYNAGHLVVADKFNDRVEVFSDPRNRSLADSARFYGPWGLLLLIPLALLPLLLRRRRSYVVAPAFADALLNDPDGEQIAAVLKRVVGASALAAAHTDDFKDLKWRDLAPKDDVVSELMDTYGLETQDAEALAVALSTRGNVVLLSQNKALNKAADERSVSVLTLEELREVLHGKDNAPTSRGTRAASNASESGDDADDAS